jgi:hypothetical protein
LSALRGLISPLQQAVEKKVYFQEFGRTEGNKCLNRPVAYGCHEEFITAFPNNYAVSRLKTMLETLMPVILAFKLSLAS